MFAIISDAFGALGWGLAVAVGVTVVAVQLGKALCHGFYWNVWSVIAAAALFVLTLVQGTLWVGSMYARGYVGNVAAVAHVVAEQGQAAVADAQGGVAQAGSESVEAIREKLADEYPLLRSYISDIDLEQAGQLDVDGVVTAIEADVNSAITWYQVRRLLWMLGFAIAAIIIICSKSGRAGLSYDATGSYSQTSSSGLKF